MSEIRNIRNISVLTVAWVIFLSCANALAWFTPTYPCKHSCLLPCLALHLFFTSPPALCVELFPQPCLSTAAPRTGAPATTLTLLRWAATKSCISSGLVWGLDYFTGLSRSEIFLHNTAGDFVLVNLLAQHCCQHAGDFFVGVGRVQIYIYIYVYI
jgi:hypothetical protein